MSASLLAMASTLVAAQPAAPPPAPPSPARIMEPARAGQPLATLFSMDDYPNEAFRAGASGTVEFTLTVDRRGQPTRCFIRSSSGNAALDRATCDILMARARFTPARDAAGNAVEDLVAQRVRWVLPAEGDWRLPFAPTLTFTEMHVAADGAIQCRERLNAFNYEVTDERCGDFADADSFVMRGVTATVITAFTPDGSLPQPGDRVARGAPTIEGAARLRVAPDGRLLECRVTRRPSPKVRAGLQAFLDPCRLPAFDQDPMFRPDNARTQAHNVTLTFRLYIRPDPAR